MDPIGIYPQTWVLSNDTTIDKRDPKVANNLGYLADSKLIVFYQL